MARWKLYLLIGTLVAAWVVTRWMIYREVTGA
jgi:hypothetical protein